MILNAGIGFIGKLSSYELNLINQICRCLIYLIYINEKAKYSFNEKCF